MTTTAHGTAHVCDLLDILADAVLMVDARQQIVYANEAVGLLLGHLPRDLLGAPLDTLIPASLRARHAALADHYQRNGTPMRMGSRPALHALHRNGDLVPVSISLCNWTQPDGQRVSVVVMHDVTALHSHLDRATELAKTDALTGLGNRLRLSRWMQQRRDRELPFALLYLDLRQFKQLNDTLGHAAGDQALQIVARRLQAQVRAADLVARLGGDEFVVAFDGLDDAAHLAERARLMADALGRPLHLAATTCRLSANMGGALCPLHGRSEAALLGAADRAMYRAKQSGEDYHLAEP